MLRPVFLDNALRENWNDDATATADGANPVIPARNVRFYTTGGAVASTRAYTTAEIATADAIALSATTCANGSTIDANLLADLETLQAMIVAANNTINANPASYIKDLARVQRRIVRRVIGKLDGTT